MKLQSPVAVKVVTPVGYSFSFKPNEPQTIPPLAVQYCLSAGCHVVEGELTQEERKIVEVVRGPERDRQIGDAMKKLVARNGREDFTGSGKPNAVVLSEMLGYQVYAKERDELWEKVAVEIGDEV